MDSPEEPTGKPLRVVPKDKTPTKKRFVSNKPALQKKPDFVVKPYPEDFTKGKLDMSGAFRFNKPADAMEWAHKAWSNPDNQLVAYVYRQIPVCRFDQSSAEPNPELGHSIGIWKSWPFDSLDYHTGILHKFGAGTYLILWTDMVAGRKIAKIEEWEFPNYETYPPMIRIDDVLIDSPKNKNFIAWARGAGCLFSIDKGYTPGKFVHIETQRHRKPEEDYMPRGPLGEALEEAAGGIIKDAVENFRNPQPQATSSNAANLDHMAAVAAIDIVKDTHNEMAARKGEEQTALLGLVTKLVEERAKPDTSQSEGFKFALDTMNKMHEMQVQMMERDRESLIHRLDRFETQQRQPVATIMPPDPQDALLNYIEKQEAIMQRLGYTKRNASQAAHTVIEQAPPPRDLVGTLIESLPSILQTMAQAYMTHLQVQLRITELQTMGRQAPPMQQQPPPQQPPPAQARPPAAATAPTPTEPVTVRINEEMRREVGPDFDMYVNNFHEELAKIDKMICAKFINGTQHIVKNGITEMQEQLDVMADFGAELANWYLEIPGNGHAIIASYKPILLNVLKTYKPVWDVMSVMPKPIQDAFIEGFCEPERLDVEEGPTNTEAVN